MNLTFVFDGYLAETALEQSFELFVFDGYLIYGEVPPPTPSEGGAAAGANVGGRYNLYREIEEEKKRKRKQQEELILIVLMGWSEYYNQN